MLERVSVARYVALAGVLLAAMIARPRHPARVEQGPTVFAATILARHQQGATRAEVLRDARTGECALLVRVDGVGVFRVRCGC